MKSEIFDFCAASERALYLALLFTQPLKRPSKGFSLLITGLLIIASAFFSSEISPVFPLIIPFIKEWISVGIDENFPAYLFATSYLVLILCCLAQIKGAAFDMACYLKQNYGIRIVP